jgi:hypothetical protein
MWFHVLLSLLSVGLAAGIAVVACAETIALDAINGMGRHVDAVNAICQAAESDEIFVDKFIFVQLLRQLMPTFRKVHFWWTFAVVKLLDLQLRDFGITAGTV